MPENLCNSSKIEMGSHSGTHIDAPYHMLISGDTIDKTPLDKYIGKGICITADIKNNLILLPELDKETSDFDVLIIYTGWTPTISPQQEFSLDFPGMSDQLCDFIISKKIKLFGTDMPSIDTDLDFNNHKRLLSNNIAIVEGLVNLDQIVNKTFTFIALPLNLKGLDGSPTRAIALL